MNTLSELKPDKRNIRKHTPRNIALVERALQEVGAARSIVIDEDNNILAGNGTVEAAGNVGLEKMRIIDASGDEIIAVRRTGLTEEQKQKLSLFDNRSGELAGWDIENLKILEGKGLLEGVFSQTEMKELEIEEAKKGLVLPDMPGEQPKEEIVKFIVRVPDSIASQVMAYLDSLESKGVRWTRS